MKSNKPDTLRVNEIFYSLQGEGYFTGTPAIFIRLSGCNLSCPFCDTDHGEGILMEWNEIVDDIKKYPARHVVITGGEPTLQLTEGFVELLHDSGYFVQIETNGTLLAPRNIDWITCSPKNKNIVYSNVNELKLVFRSKEDADLLNHIYEMISARHYFVQPCDEKDDAKNACILNDCVAYIKSHPQWRLSLQTHKLINIP